MSLWKIAWRSIQQRGLASVLTAASMALGVMLVVAVVSAHGLIEKSFRDNASFGYNLIIGPKGGSLQLTMNSVYYLSQPIENIPYDYYLDLLEATERDRQYEHSIQRRAYDANWETTLGSASASADLPLSGWAAIGEQLLLDSVQRATAERWNYREFFVQKVGRPPIGALEIGRATNFGGYVDFAIPLCLGDYLGPFRVVGTTPAMFDSLKHGDAKERRKFEFAQGRNFREWSPEHGYFEAVIGATVARDRKLTVGDLIAPSHGAEDGSEHAQKFTVVGVLKPSGTPQDRGVFINMEGFFLMEDHAKPLEKDPDAAAQSPADREAGGPAASADAGGSAPPQTIDRLPIEQREVTAVLVSATGPAATMYLENLTNEGTVAQAVTPVKEITRLFELIVKPIRLALLGLTVMICIVSGVSILVSIYNSMNDRRHEIAVMRALGAGRGTVMSVILLESVMLSLLGGLVGWGSAHVVIGILGPSIEYWTGVSVGMFDLAPRTIDVADVLRAKPQTVTRVFRIGWIALAAGGALVLGFGLVAALVRRTLSDKLPLFAAAGIVLLLASAAVRSAVDGRASPEILVVPALILLAMVVGFLPALTAYRTDVAKSLGK